MEYRQLGRSGLRVSKLCLGTMFGFTKDLQEDATRIVHEAIDNGVNFVDTADVYKESEEVLGAALAQDGKRDQVVLATKFGWYTGDGPNDYGTSRQHIIDACEDSLRKLRTDHIDLYILHVLDPNTPFEETLYSLDTLVRQGKVRYLGTSKHPSFCVLEMLHLAEKHGWAPIVSEQPPYNLLDRMAENEHVPMAIRHGLGITPYMPVASGLLSGKYAPDGSGPEDARMNERTLGEDRIFTREALEVVDKLVPLAEAKGVSLPEFSLAWLMHQPGVTAPILGARKLDYLRAGIRACEITFSDEELAAVDEIRPPGTYVSNFFEPNYYLPMRMAYSSAARRKMAGAFIPDTKTGSGRGVGYET